MNIYHYLFYRIYKRQNTKFSKTESVIFSVIVLSSVLFLNIFTLGIFFYRLDFLPVFIESKFQVLILAFSIIVFNLLVFFRRKKYLYIESKFQEISKNKNTVGTIIIILYVVLSFIVFFLATNFRR